MRGIVFVFFLLLTSATEALCQNIFFGARVGGFIADWENSGSLSTFQSRSSAMWTFNLFGRQEIVDDFYIGIDIGYNRSTAELNILQPERMVAKGNGPTLAFWSIGPTARKDFNFSNGKIGFQTSLSLPLSYIRFNRYNYSGDEFRSIIRVGDKQPVRDIFVYGEAHTNKKFNVFLRPEIGFFYRMNPRSRLSIDAMWGINTGEPLVTRNFHEITYEGQTFTQNRHTYDGQYLNFTIGYELKLFN